MSRNTRYGVALILLAVLLAAYAYRVFTFAKVADGRGRVLASTIRSYVPSLRVPLFFPVHSSNPKRNPSDVAFATTSVGSLGACTYWTLRTCQAFWVSSDILDKPQTLAALLRFLDEPCQTLRSPTDAGHAAPADERAARAFQRERARRVATAVDFFGCAKSAHNSVTLLLNFVEPFDDPAQLPNLRIRYRVEKRYY
jgi:hypothetical protein